MKRLLFRLFLLLVCGISIVLHFKIDDAYFNFTEFSYFTVQSNIFCFIMMSVLVIKEWTHKDFSKPVYLFFHGMATSAILSTAYIYHFCESVNKYPLKTQGIFSIPAMDLFGHYIVPVLCVMDWFLFVPKGQLRRGYIFQWMAFPIFYLLCFLSRCNFNPETTFEKVEKYPYFFLNYERLGPLYFCKYIFYISIIMLTINTLLYTSDYILSHKKTDR